MKNWKHWTFVAVIAIVGIIIGFMACDSSKNDPVLCKCENKQHLEAGQSCDCGGENCNCSEKLKVKPDTTILLSFVDYNGYYDQPPTPCNVTIKSDEMFTIDEWNILLDKVVNAIMRGYNKYNDVVGLTNAKNKAHFEGVFRSTPLPNASSDHSTIIKILPNSATYNCEVKSDDYRIMYLKISSIDTIDLVPAVDVMSGEYQIYKDGIIDLQ